MVGWHLMRMSTQVDAWHVVDECVSWLGISFGDVIDVTLVNEKLHSVQMKYKITHKGGGPVDPAVSVGACDSLNAVRSSLTSTYWLL